MRNSLLTGHFIIAGYSNFSKFWRNCPIVVVIMSVLAGVAFSVSGKIIPFRPRACQWYLIEYPSTVLSRRDNTTPSPVDTIYPSSITCKLLLTRQDNTTPSPAGTIYPSSITCKLLLSRRDNTTPSPAGTIYPSSITCKLLLSRQDNTTPSPAGTIYPSSITCKLLLSRRDNTTPSPVDTIYTSSITCTLSPRTEIVRFRPLQPGYRLIQSIRLSHARSAMPWLLVPSNL